MLVMCIPDTARLSITARVADSALQNMALTVGTQVQPAGTAQVTAAITADSLSQTDTGSVDLSGLCLTSEGPDGSLTYGTVVDEPLDGSGSFAVRSLKGA